MSDPTTKTAIVPSETLGFNFVLRLRDDHTDDEFRYRLLIAPDDLPASDDDAGFYVNRRMVKALGLTLTQWARYMEDTD